MSYKTALVTGASSGIGRGLALALARRGTHVVAAARRKAQLDSLVEEAAKDGGSIEALVMDVADADRTHDTVRALDERLSFELVIANAGTGAPTPGKRLEWKTVKQIFDINVMGATATLAGALPGMVARKSGHIVGISSVAAWRGLPRFGAYCASKAALTTFLESLRVDLHGTAIAVTSVHPGYVRTELTAKNKGPMPFLVELDDAVAIILRALDRREAICAFPLPVVAALRATRALPAAIYEFVASMSPKNLGT